MFEIGITEVRSEIGIMGLQTTNSPQKAVRLKRFYARKLELWDYTPFEIRIIG